MLYEQFFFKTCAIYTFFLLIFFLKKKGKRLKSLLTNMSQKITCQLLKLLPSFDMVCHFGEIVL